MLGEPVWSSNRGASCPSSQWAVLGILIALQNTHPSAFLRKNHNPSSGQIEIMIKALIHCATPNATLKSQQQIYAIPNHEMRTKH
jgi:hypothetical protein